jgi:hypothetical protein
VTVYQASPAIDEARRRSADPGPAGGGTPAANTEALTGARRESGPDCPPAVPAGYRPLHKLGEGTYGQVWLFEEEHTGIRVAVKFFARGAGQQWWLLQADVKQLALLHGDPGIVQLLDVAAEASPPYYVMTHAAGGSLAGLLEKGPLAVPRALRIFGQVTRALAYVHAKGIRHCDLKPGNVLLDACGRALLADFGQAHLCSDDSPALGTFFYMAPEQADLSQAVPDTRWDVYGLGALLYAMVTGSPPRDDGRIRTELDGTLQLGHRLRRYREWVSRAPVPDGHYRAAGMDTDLARVIDRCLELDPERRLRDAGAVLAALDQREQLRRRRPLLAASLAATLAGLALLGGVAFLLARGVRERSERAIIDRVLRNDETMARLVASVLDGEVERRLRSLEGRAQRSELGRQLAQDPDARAPLTELLKGMRVGNTGRALFDRLTLADGRGRLVAADPPLPPQPGRTNYSWREWYNGERHHYDAKDALFPALGRERVSGPYVSKEKDGPKEALVAFSCPVADPGQPGRSVGVLVGILKVEALSAWLPLEKLGQNHGAVLVLNRHGHLLLDTRHADAVRLPPDSDPPEVGGASLDALVKGRQDLSAPDIEDPVGGGTRWTASGVPIQTAAAGWSVVVAHERGAALEPLRNLSAWLRGVGLSVLGAVGVFAVGLWAWLLRFLRREAETGHA